MLRVGRRGAGLPPGVKAPGVFDGACCILNLRKHSLPSRSAPVPVNSGNKGRSRSLSSATVFLRGRGPAPRFATKVFPKTGNTSLREGRQAAQPQTVGPPTLRLDREKRVQ
jgi:hypothetical protein